MCSLFTTEHSVRGSWCWELARSYLLFGRSLLSSPLCGWAVLQEVLSAAALQLSQLPKSPKCTLRVLGSCLIVERKQSQKLKFKGDITNLPCKTFNKRRLKHLLYTYFFTHEFLRWSFTLAQPGLNLKSPSGFSPWVLELHPCIARSSKMCLSIFTFHLFVYLVCDNNNFERDHEFGGGTWIGWRDGHEVLMYVVFNKIKSQVKSKALKNKYQSRQLIFKKFRYLCSYSLLSCN